MATGLSKKKWNGKTLHLNSPNHKNGWDISLSYEGKKPESVILATPPVASRLLWQGRDSSSDQFQNNLYYGDNLVILASLIQDTKIKGKVRLIYIDPPFSTRSIFQSRSQIDAYQDLFSGSNYIELMRERLILIRELLASDGSIYVHLDDNMVFYIKAIMDEVFGRNNFRNCIIRKKCNPKNYTHRVYGNISDYLLFYTKSNTYAWNRPVGKWTLEHAEREYPYIDEKTGRRYKKVPIHAPGERNGETGKPWHGMNPPPGKHWQFPPKTLDELDKRGEIYWSPNGNPRRKIYFDESNGIPIQDIWLEFRDAHNQMIKITGYPTEKNPELLSRIIEASSNVGDLVLDCFSGSGTTLAVASELGRQWIGIDNSTEAIAATLRRFAGDLQRMGDFVTTGHKKPQQGEFALLRRRIIKNFSLYAAEPYGGELEEIISQWR